MSVPTLLLLVALSVVPGQAQARPAPAKPAIEPNLVVRLKHLPAREFARIVTELFGKQSSRISLSVDESTNSLILVGSKEDAATIINLLERLDVEGRRDERRPAIRVFPLRSVPADASTEAILRLVHSGPVVVNKNLNVVVAQGDTEALARVQALLLELEERTAAPAAGVPPAELLVRLTWLSGVPRDGAPGLPDELKDLAGELRRLGLASPRLAAQLSVSAMPGSNFELSGPAREEGPYQLTASGTLGDKGDPVALALTLSVAALGRNQPPVHAIRTQTTVPVGRPVIVAASRSQAEQSAFVVQLVRRGEARAQVRR